MSLLVWSILLLLIGLALVVLELFLPSGGILGLVAAVAIVASVSIAFFSSIGEGAVMLAVVMVTIPATVVLGLKVWPMTPMGKAILNRHAMENDPRPSDQRADLVGRVGIAKSKMLPSGAITVDGRTYNAVTSGMAVEAGQAIRIVKISGNSIIVQPHEGPINPAEASPDAVLGQSIESLGLDPFDDESSSG